MLISLSVLQPFLTMITCKYDPVLINYLGNEIDHYFSIGRIIFR